MTEKSNLLLPQRDYARVSQDAEALSTSSTRYRQARRSWVWAVLAAVCFGALIHTVMHHHGGHNKLPKDPDAAAKLVLKSTPVIVSQLYSVISPLNTNIHGQQDGHIGMEHCIDCCERVC